MADFENERDYRQEIEESVVQERAFRTGSRRMSRKKLCGLCREKVDIIDFKDVRMLQAFAPERGKIMPRRISSNCAIHQRMLAEAIKRARNIALLPYVTD